MFIKKLTIINFRNYINFKIDFSDNINLIVGENGAGKTNILEAIYFMFTTISHRTNSINELIREKEDAFKVTGEINNNSGKFNIEVKYKKGEGIKAGINFSKVKRNVLISKFPVVMFSPEDIEVIKGTPDKLRKIINIIISQQNPGYISFLIKYRKLLKVRNVLLKEKGILNNHRKRIVLNTWTKTLIEYASKITYERNKFIINLNKAIETETQEMGINDKITIKYNNNLYKGDSSIKDDLHFAYTTWGPHRESYDFCLNNRNLKKYGSRGEIRITAIIFRLAVWRIFKENKGSEPIVLLDDVFSELDEGKRKIIKARLKNMQSVITLTEVPEDLNSTANIILI